MASSDSPKSASQREIGDSQNCGQECVQQRLACSVGVSPTEERIRILVAWVAAVEETKPLKPIDKAILGIVSESPGRNVSEPVGGPVNKLLPKAEPSPVGRRLHDTSKSDRYGASLRRGGRGSTVTRTCRATGEAVHVPPRNRRSKVRRITGDPGKSMEDETVAAGSVVVMKRGNSRGAKGPCCTRFRSQHARQG